MTLFREFSLLAESLDAKADKATLTQSQEFIDGLLARDVASKALKTGDIAPDFVRSDVYGKGNRLSSFLKRGPVILVFYRGGWCPFCSLTLRSYQSVLPEIEKAGASLVAMSTESADESILTRSKDSLEFSVLTDKDNSISKAFGVLFELTDPMIAFFKSRKLDLEKINGSKTWTLPVPATYVIDVDRKIIGHHVEIDHRKRMEPSEAINIVKAAKTNN
jgi:peroxiredoxin